jgi:ankyrin repeat protein
MNAIDLIQPTEMASEAMLHPWSSRGRDVWAAILAARAGDVARLRELLARDPGLARYGEPLRFAVREGRAEAVALLLEAGADPAVLGRGGESLATSARDRGHEDVARRIEAAGRPAWALGTGSDHAIHGAAEADDVEQVEALLDGEPELLARPDARGRTPLSRAVSASARRVTALLLARGADPKAFDGVDAPTGRALWTAARAGDRELVELLLDHGADPNAQVEGSGSPTWAASTPELRALLMARGGALDCFDLIFLNEDDEAVRRVQADPRAGDAGCGGVFTAAATLGKRELVVRLLAAGAKVPPVLTSCRSYLLEDAEILRLLLAGGMDPDQPDWQRATPLHELCGRDRRGRPRPARIECAGILLDAGADISARDEEYRSTPLAWAARNDLPEMVELLLARRAPTRLADDEPWATPLAWASRRGHAEVEALLRAAGATS